MTEQKTLQRVLDYTSKCSDQAAREVARLQREVDDKTARLNALEQYHVQYCDDLNAAARQGIDVSQYRSQSYFINNMNKVIEMQAQEVKACQQIFDQTKSNWLTQRVKQEAVNKLLDKCVETKAHKVQKEEQMVLDAYAAKHKALWGDE